MSLSLDDIQPGYFYEINPSKLTPKHPQQLKQIRILMVSDKTESGIAVRYPSVFSLRTYLNGGVHTRKDNKRMPALDEKYVMDVRTAREVFVKMVSGKELEEMKAVSSFWLSTGGSGGGGSSGGVSKKGLCWSQLTTSSMVHWGKRRRVRFLSRHEDSSNDNNNNNNTSNPLNNGTSYNLQLLSSSVRDENEDEDEDVDEDGGTDLKEEEEGGGGDEESESRKNKKRNRNNTKKTMMVNKKNTTAGSGNRRRNQTTYAGKRKIVKHFISRWSVDRYNLAEHNMHKIMKEKGAVFGNPILRPELRTEARKLIGDTGLLDHLLKHMAGKLAPGGEDRFRRRHNTDGAMEYWLESADLMTIRKEAGVQDPYWIPPPGWQPGDNPSQDPVCAREIKALKEQVAVLKRKMEKLESEKEQGCRDLVLVDTPASINMQSHISLAQCLKEKYNQLVQEKAAIEEQLKEICQSPDRIEEEAMVLSSIVEGSKASTVKTPSQDIIIVPSRKEQEKDEHLRNDDKIRKYTENTDGNNNKGTASPEDKATKIQRLKTGFRICKPQGTFLWPNMAPPPGGAGGAATPVHHLENFLVPTPPSASSSTAPPLLPNQPTSPVKPLAEKRHVSVATTTAITSVMKPITGFKESYDSINLNYVPISYSHHIDCHQHRGLQLGAPHTPSSSASPLTYRRRRNNSPTAGASISGLRSNQWERQIKQGHGHENEQQIREILSNSSMPSSSSMPQNAGGSSWLALATPNPTLPKPTRGYSSPC